MISLRTLPITLRTLFSSFLIIIGIGYLTALSFRTGETVYERLAGTGLGYNSNYAPVSIGPDGSVYVGALGGLIALRDG